MNTEILAYGSPAYLLQKQMTEENYDLDAWLEMEGESYVRAVVGSGWFKGTGLIIPDGATEADMTVAMRASRAMHSSDAWMRGDIINWLRDNKYQGGDIPRVELNRLAAELGVASAKRLLNNATTSKNWPLANRYPAADLSYSHHEELNSLPLAEKLAWAQRIIEEGLSVVALRALLADEKVETAEVTTADENGVLKTMPVEFVASKLDKDAALGILSKAIATEIGKSTGPTHVRNAVEKVLKAFMGEGLLHLPVRAWKEALAQASVATTAPTTEPEEEE